MDQKPTVGRIVHYQPHDIPTGIPRAALVTEAYDRDVSSPGETVCVERVVDLCVFSPSGMQFLRQVRFSETLAEGRWTWPPRS